MMTAWESSVSLRSRWLPSGVTFILAAVFLLLGAGVALGEPEGDGLPPELARGSDESAGAWVRRLEDAFTSSEEVGVRKQILSAWAADGGREAVRALLNVFDAEKDRAVRDHLNEVLVQVGTKDVASHMDKHMRAADDPVQEDALQVVYGCLARPEEEVPEEPFCDAMRQFFKLGDTERTPEAIRQLDELGRSGTRALGQLLYLDDFQCGGTSSHVLCLTAFKTRRDDWRAAEILFDTFPKKVPKTAPTEEDPTHLIKRGVALDGVGTCCLPGLIKLLGNRTFSGFASRCLRDIYNQQSLGSQEDLPDSPSAWKKWWKKQKDLEKRIKEIQADRSY